MKKKSAMTLKLNLYLSQNNTTTIYKIFRYKWHFKQQPNFLFLSISGLRRQDVFEIEFEKDIENTQEVHFCKIFLNKITGLTHIEPQRLFFFYYKTFV